MLTLRAATGGYRMAQQEAARAAEARGSERESSLVS
jgi:hypothetical protein